MRERARAAPAPSVASQQGGGLSRRLRIWGMTRTDNKPLFRSKHPQRSALLEARAQSMRASLTSTEQLRWSPIRGRRLGVMFRRQVPLLGRFIAGLSGAR